MRYGRLLLILQAFALLPAAPAHSTALPKSPNAPAVGSKAPDFTLPDTNGNPVTLSKLYEAQRSARGAWVLLVFYRGYW